MITQFTLKGMPRANLLEKLSQVRSGKFAYVTFFSNPKTIDGSVIYKVSKVHTQCKIDYTNRKDYVEPTYKREEDSTYLIDKALKVNNKTGNTLLVIYPVNGSIPTTTYYNANGEEMTKEQATAIMKPKSKSNSPIIFMTPNADNILEICGG